MNDTPTDSQTTSHRLLEARLRKWLEVATPGWSYPLDRKEVVCLLSEIDRLRGSLEVAGEGDGAL
jgi:hypothetical protein